MDLLPKVKRLHYVAAMALVSCMLASCGGQGGGHHYLSRHGHKNSAEPVQLAAASATSPRDGETSDKATVALLLPLSGESAGLGQAMLDAAQMALFETGSQEIVIRPIDTASDTFTATKAAQQAASDHAKLILGPLFSASTRVVAPVAKQHGIPVVSLSNDKSLAGNGVFLLGFQPDQQIQRVTEYALDRGVKDFAAIVPNDAYGTMANERYKQTLAARGGTLRQSEYYMNGVQLGEGFAPLVESVKTSLPSGQPSALLVPQGGEPLVRIATLANTNGHDKNIQLLGSGQWDDTRVLANPAVQGGWFAGVEPERRQPFEQRFKAAYGYSPPRLASLAYDGVALAAALPSLDNGKFSATALTHRQGFMGVDGIFRLREDGMSERGLAVLQVDKGSVRVVDPSPKQFH